MEEQLSCPHDLVELSPEEGQGQIFSLEQLLKAVKRLNSLQPRLRARKSLQEGITLSGYTNAFRSKGEDEGLGNDVEVSIGCM